MISEETLNTWSQPPSETDQTKADNAERIIRETLQASPKLAHLALRIFTQGSYRANTNTRLNSDVDICVLSSDAFFYDLDTHHVAFAETNIAPATLQYREFRHLVQNALVDRFGTGVTRGNKAFDIHANTYRLDADVVTAFERRRYFKGAAGRVDWVSGIAFLTDSGLLIENWPEQTYANGVAKNTRTGRRYKAAIRILKRLRDRMQDESIAAANDVGSFFIESLIWNVPDDQFPSSSCRALVRSVLAFLWNETRTEETCSEWGEVNELKYLFRPASTRAHAQHFIDAAWNYIGFD